MCKPPALASEPTLAATYDDPRQLGLTHRPKALGLTVTFTLARAEARAVSRPVTVECDGLPVVAVVEWVREAGGASGHAGGGSATVAPVGNVQAVRPVSVAAAGARREGDSGMTVPASLTGWRAPRWPGIRSRSRTACRSGRTRRPRARGPGRGPVSAGGPVATGVPPLRAKLAEDCDRSAARGAHRPANRVYPVLRGEIDHEACEQRERDSRRGCWRLAAGCLSLRAASRRRRGCGSQSTAPGALDAQDPGLPSGWTRAHMSC
jgi:hypothetical protein